MPLEYMTFYTRPEIRANPSKLFVFGDNFARKGFGGQAKEARGEPNAVGIPTKRKPTYAKDAYLTDSDLEEWKAIAAPEMQRLINWLNGGFTVVWPQEGIGTGLANLENEAPSIFAAIREFERSLKVQCSVPALPKRNRPIEEFLGPIPIPIIKS